MSCDQLSQQYHLLDNYRRVEKDTSFTSPNFNFNVSVTSHEDIDIKPIFFSCPEAIPYRTYSLSRKHSPRMCIYRQIRM
jgi:hypothetical protein